MTKFGLLFSIFVLVCQSVWSQTSGDFRSVKSGNWNDSDTWERYKGSKWVSSGSIPTDVNANNIIIQNGHTVTVSDNRTADQITIDAGGQATVSPGITWTIADGTGIDLIISGALINSGVIVYESNNTNAYVVNGATYIHSYNGGTIPTVTWEANSTCLITGITSTLPTGMNQTFGHLTWDCPEQTTSDPLTSLFTVNGNFTINSTGESQLKLAEGTTNIAKNYSQTGGSIRLAGGTSASLNVGGNFSLSDGTFLMSDGAATGTLNVAGNFSHTGGTITETSTGNGSIVFNGTKNQDFTGGGTVSNTIYFTINNPAGITLLSSVTFPSALTITNGNITTGSNALTLGSAASLIGEAAGKYIIGNVVNTQTLGTNSSNFSGLGISLDAGTDDIGTVTVTRVSGSNGAVTFDGKTGINRNWTITSDNPPTNGRILSLSWVSDDDNNKDLTSAQIWKSTDVGSSWFKVGSQQDASGTRTVSTSVNSFSIFTVSDGANPLPVELSSFSASVIGAAIKLSWRTETEVNNYGFEILRQGHTSTALSVTDWEKIGFVEGYGNSNSPKDYSFTDARVLSGTYSYRLKQIDIDGQFEYSKTIEVNLGAPNKYELAQNFPNPFNPNTSIKFTLPETGTVKLTVYNMLGQEIATLVNGVKEAGTHIINFDAEGLNSGIYMYRIESNGFNEVRKMTLIK